MGGERQHRAPRDYRTHEFTSLPGFTFSRPTSSSCSSREAESLYSPILAGKAGADFVCRNAGFLGYFYDWKIIFYGGSWSRNTYSTS